MTTRRVLIWRHGRTEWNAANRMQGQTDVALDETGVRQAREAAPLLAAESPDAIVSSDLVRARDTAGALAAVTGLPVRLDARLRETAFGPWEGLVHEEIAAGWPAEYARWRHGEGAHVPGAEVPTQVAARMRAAIDEASEAVDGTLVVVSHGGAARRAVQALLGWSDEATDRISALGNCRWSELRHTARGWRLHAHNVGPVAGPASATEPATTADVEPASDDDTLAAPGTR